MFLVPLIRSGAVIVFRLELRIDDFSRAVTEGFACYLSLKDFASSTPPSEFSRLNTQSLSHPEVRCPPRSYQKREMLPCYPCLHAALDIPD